ARGLDRDLARVLGGSAAVEADLQPVRTRGETAKGHAVVCGRLPPAEDQVLRVLPVDREDEPGRLPARLSPVAPLAPEGEPHDHLGRTLHAEALLAQQRAGGQEREAQGGDHLRYFSAFSFVTSSVPVSMKPCARESCDSLPGTPLMSATSPFPASRSTRHLAASWPPRRLSVPM